MSADVDQATPKCLLSAADVCHDRRHPCHPVPFIAVYACRQRSYLRLRSQAPARRTSQASRLPQVYGCSPAERRSPSKRLHTPRLLYCASSQSFFSLAVSSSWSSLTQLSAGWCGPRVPTITMAVSVQRLRTCRVAPTRAPPRRQPARLYASASSVRRRAGPTTHLPPGPPPPFCFPSTIATNR